ncbi:MAG: 16S rRNA (guanine(527)-N(7))-methyltransferase RsmG [Alphaproteobacteria bacterium]|nr:16S rRNA (guanine(527)-N(7))-methyltransferase RsmG [Alphaproteobacteria bacterium]
MDGQKQTASGAASVSRETLEKYVQLLLKWNQKINLIGPSTESEIWERHIKDSLQIVPLIPKDATSIVDLGSGAGLPGLVIASQLSIPITLIERDQRKCAFLAEAIRICEFSHVTLSNSDARNSQAKYNVIMARALSSIDGLLTLCESMIMENSICFFPKGKTYAIEIAEAQGNWNFDYQATPSLTQSDAVILTISKIKRK